jgi:hypothetical protein
MARLDRNFAPAIAGLALMALLVLLLRILARKALPASVRLTPSVPPA